MENSKENMHTDIRLERVIIADITEIGIFTSTKIIYCRVNLVIPLPQTINWSHTLARFANKSQKMIRCFHDIHNENYAK